MKIQNILSALVVSAGLLVSGCAHNIDIKPTAQLADTKSTKIEKVVGVYITPTDRALVTTSPGGGGDDLTYSPYKDLEGPINLMLANIYTKVESLPKNDAATLEARKINLVIAPKLSTVSSSTSSLTWPPTDFSVTIKASALDVSGKVLWEESVTGTGKAEFKEFVTDHPLAARRASRDALNKLEVVIRAREAQK